nr:type I polyketide synthase [Saccharomonospora piscinae]
MSAESEQIVEALRTSLIENERLRAQNQKLTAATVEPVAIVGASCRFPGGVRSPEDLWRLVHEGTDAITPYPVGRGWEMWFGADGPAPHGGFVHEADLFDPSVFGISPREALVMDPQQRLLLEASWEALERAGIDPRSARDTRTGVYVGASPSGYSATSVGSGDSDGFVVTGTANSVLAGRISYSLGLLGPALTIDTACSSSLVALHVAAQALRRQECALALAGGVTVMANPAAFVEFGRQGGVAADGRCKSFSESADGTGWGEGVGLVLLERLSDAQRNGHEVLAVIRGSAVNSDGASNGLTAPNGNAQRRVIRQALADARLSASDVDAVEAHGTGTTLGDPIEARALLATYGADRAEPLWLGSIKSNIGHTQAAAGIAGVLKMIEGIRRGVLPRTLHADVPSAKVDWSAGAVRLLDVEREWPVTGRPRRAAVSAFGMSGTNAHLVVEQAPGEAAGEPVAAGTPEPAVGSGAVAWVVSGRTRAALRAQAAKLRSWLADSTEQAEPAEPADVGWSLAHTRAALEHRAAVTGRDREALLAGLSAIADGEPAPGVVTAQAGERGNPVFVFPGQGAQWEGMAAGLLASSPVFADRLAECERALAPWVDWSVTGVLRRAPGSPGLDRADVVQPALWAVMVALAGLWRECGVRPAAVIGHSQGEIAAACVAGALSLADGARVVALRSRALLALAGHGGMVSLPETVADVRARLARWDGSIAVAAINGPRHVVVSGETGALDELLADCAADGVNAKRIPVDYASHSRAVESLRDEIADALTGIGPESSAVPFYSTVTGTRVDAAELDADYWYRNLRSTVDFDGAVRAALADRHPRLLEVSPHPVLAMSLSDIAEDTGSAAAIHTTLRRDPDVDDADRFVQSLADVHVHGGDVAFSELFAGARRVELPTYAFQHERFWPQPAELVAAEVTRPRDGTGLAESGAALWAAVDSGDASALAATLDLPDGEIAVDELADRLAAYRERDRRRAHVNGLRYRIEWTPSFDARPEELTGTWLVVSRDTGDDELPSVLRERGASVVTVPPGEVANVLDPARPPAGVLVVARGPDAVGDVVTALKHVAEAALDAPLWCLTRGAVAAARGDRAPDPAAAAVWGAGIVAALEYPAAWGGLVDLPPSRDREAERRLVELLARPEGEDQVAVRAQGVFVRRLVPAPAETPATATPWRASGTVLVTGATGVRSTRLAWWLAERGAEHIVLAGAAAPAPAVPGDLEADLAQFGTKVTAVDATGADALRALVERLDGEGRRVSGVVHVAESPDQGSLLAATDAETLSATVAEETGLVAALDEVLDTPETAAFVVLTSTAATWGSAGFAGHAATGAFAEAIVRRRRSRGLPGTAVAWLPWADGSERSTGLEEQLGRRGLRLLPPDTAVDALQQALDNGDRSVAVADADWGTFASTFTVARPSALLSGLPDAVPVDSGDADGPDGAAELAGQLADTSPAERRRLLLDLVRKHVAVVLGHSSVDAVDPERAFLEQGFDSLTAVELRNALRAASGAELSATLLFDHPSPAQLADHLADVLTGQAGTGARAESSPAEPGGILGALFEHTMRPGGRPDSYSLLLQDLARYRPSYADPAEAAGPQNLMRLADGPATSLVCCCTVALGSGFQEYARFAGGARGRRPVYALRHPGFTPGEPMPESYDVLIATHVRTLLDTFGDEPFVLTGHSAGAMFANSIAAALADEGRPPAALVLLDSYPVGSTVLAKWLPEMFSGMAEVDGAFTPMDDTRITAWAGYVPLVENWQAQQVAVPTLLARADSPLGEVDDEHGWRSTWPFPHDEIDARGDHFSMLGENGPALAAGIGEWLSERGL